MTRKLIVLGTVGLLLLLTGMAAIISLSGGENPFSKKRLLRSLEPKFQVTEVDVSEGTMTLRQPEHEFIVRCGVTCNTFKVGESYSMSNEGHVLRYEMKRQQFDYPIVQEEIILPMTPAGHG